MSIHYLLDGYNIIHQMPALKLAKLEDQRRELLRFIEKHSPQGSLRNQVTVVFDGSQDVFGVMQSSAAKIIFSQGESADDKIRTIVAQADNTKNIIVVTDDRDIQYAVGALGAKAVSVQEFLSTDESFGKKLKRIKNISAEQKKHISKADESKITSEFGKIWLKPNHESKR